MRQHIVLMQLIGSIYDCAIGAKRWPDTLEQITKYVGGEAASLSLQEPVQRDVRLISQWGFTPEAERLIMGAAPLNPLMSSGWYAEIDRPFTGEAVLGKKNYLRTRFYNEAVAPSGFYDAAVTILARNAHRFGAVSIASAVPIEKLMLYRVAQVAPHLRRAVDISDMLDSRSLQRDALSAALDLLTLGLVLVDAKARICYANAVACELLADGKSVRRDGDNLSCCDPKTARELLKAIEVATKNQVANLPSSGIALPIVASEGIDLAAWILPLDGGVRAEMAVTYSAKAAVFLRQLGRVSPFPGELFVRRYSISPAECRVLMMLTQGMTLKETARTLGISDTTAKSHLRRLFEKTQTSRQAELMKLTMSALAPASIVSSRKL